MPPTAKAPTKSCLSCASAMSVSAQQAKLGRDFGGTICGLKLLMIEKPGISNGHPVKQASNCSQYNQRLEIKDEARNTPIEIPVAIPFFSTDPDADDSTGDPKKVTSCNGCRFFVDRRNTNNQIGWESGFCRAKGALIQDDRLWRYAANCDKKQQVRSRDDDLHRTQITLFPEFTTEYGRPSVTGLLRKLKEGTHEDPWKSEPDRVATDKGKTHGIRGWRRIKDQKGKGPDVYLPMFDPMFFDENVRSTIPKSGDPESPELYLDHGNYAYRAAVLWMRLKETPALWGPAGVGKTEMFRHLAWMMAAPFTRISVTESTELDDLAGKMMYSPERGTYFHYGLVPQAWQRPNVFCLDEPNTAQPAVWQFLRPMTDNSKQLVLYQNKDERLQAHQFMFLGMAMNPSWDPRNVGAQTIGDADGSRLMHIAMGLPPVEIEIEIIKQRLELDRWEKPQIDSVVAMLMRMAPEIRELSKEGHIGTSWGIRHQIKVARVKRYTSWIDAFSMGVTDSLEPAEAEAILDIVRSHTTEED